MASEADVRVIALSLPGATEEQWYQTPGYKVAGKGFLRLRTEAEGGLVVFVSDIGEKEALLTSGSTRSTPRRITTVGLLCWWIWTRSTGTSFVS